MTNPNQEGSQEKDYTPEELAFLAGIEDFKKRTGWKGLTWTEVSSIAKELGYKPRV
jgi:hypothetical protein